MLPYNLTNKQKKNIKRLQFNLQPFIFIIMNTIQIKNGINYLNEGFDTIEMSCNRTEYSLKVVVNEDETLPNYIQETFSNGFLSVETVGNDIFVVVNENNSIEGRNGFIRIKHKMDKDVVYQLNFSQSGKCMV